VFQDKKEVSAKFGPQGGMQKCTVMVEKPIQLIPFFRLFLPCFSANGRCQCITGALQFVLAEQIHMSIPLTSEQSALLVGHGNDGV
jgi:hypothetical protein